MRNVFDSVAGEIHSDPDKKWIIDIDDVQNADEELVHKLRELQMEGKREPMIEILPTKNGVHLISRPFNLKKFKSCG